jgi:hypothetical protein
VGNIKNYTIVDNALPPEEFQVFRQVFLGNDSSFPWYYVENISNTKVEENGYFSHVLFNKHGKCSSWYEYTFPLIQALNPNVMIRIKVNLYPRTECLVHHADHIDYSYDHKGAIFYLNTNDGYTVLGENDYIESVENRLLLFDPTLPHHSTNCTDKQFRANINVNYI